MSDLCKDQQGAPEFCPCEIEVRRGEKFCKGCLKQPSSCDCPGREIKTKVEIVSVLSD